MAAAVAQPYQSEHRPVTPDSIDKELDWLIEKDEKDKVGPYDSDSEASERRLSPLPLDHSNDKDNDKTFPPSPSPEHSPHPPSPSHGQDVPKPQWSESREPDISSTQDEPSTPRPFPARDSLAIDANAASGAEDDDYLSYSDDQRKANEELTSMKLDLGYTDEELPPEYDVAERVRKLNEELANEPPPDDDKERCIKFKENLVDLVAPPPPDDSEDDTVPSRENHTKSQTDQSKPAYDSNTKSANDSDSSENDQEKYETGTDNEDNSVLVERNGKFDMVNVEELTAEERELYRVSDSNDSNEHEPRPPSYPRPKTSVGDSVSRVQTHNSRRAQSAKARPKLHSEWNEEFTYKSPYAMTPKQRRELAEKQREEQRRKKEEEKYKEREQRERSQENEEAFKAWLRKKREQSPQRKRPDSQKSLHNDSSSSDENKSRNKLSYKEWLKVKKQQTKKEKEIQRHEQREFSEGWYVRPREECERAFREWLKKKNAELKRQREEDKQRARIHRLWLRQSRKSQQLAKAIKQAQAFRYVDYYGEPASTNFQAVTEINQAQPC